MADCTSLEPVPCGPAETATDPSPYNAIAKAMTVRNREPEGKAFSEILPGYSSQSWPVALGEWAERGQNRTTTSLINRSASIRQQGNGSSANACDQEYLSTSSNFRLQYNTDYPMPFLNVVHNQHPANNSIVSITPVASAIPLPAMSKAQPWATEANRMGVPVVSAEARSGERSLIGM